MTRTDEFFLFQSLLSLKKVHLKRWPNPIDFPLIDYEMMNVAYVDPPAPTTHISSSNQELPHVYPRRPLSFSSPARPSVNWQMARPEFPYPFFSSQGKVKSQTDCCPFDFFRSFAIPFATMYRGWMARLKAIC